MEEKLSPTYLLEDIFLQENIPKILESGEKLPKKETSGDSPKKIPGKNYFLCIMGDNTCLADQLILYIIVSTYNTFLIAYILHRFFQYDFKAIISSKYIQQNEQFGKNSFGISVLETNNMY